MSALSRRIRIQGVAIWGLLATLVVVAGCGLVQQLSPSPSGVSEGALLSARAGHTCVVVEDGSLWCWGSNSEGQVGDGTTSDEGRLVPVPVVGLPDRVVQVSAGGLHSCAVGEGGSLWCWRYNEHGAVGDGTVEGRLVPVPVVGLPDRVRSHGA